MVDSPKGGQEPAGVKNTYDAMPYSVNAFPQTHPDRLGVLARLFGLESARPERCRVLELGCASGGNLMPMAVAFPESQFVGIDLSARQIEEGQAVVAELGMKNLDLRAASIMDVDPAWGKFDYILAHGVYSWVPPEVQGKILEICRGNLAARGVAYISYNCYPGWHARAAIREMLWYHTERFAEPQEKVNQGRGLLAFMAAVMPGQDGGYSALLRQELGLLLKTPDSYLMHEHLEDHNEPLYFHQFMGRAAEKGLQYLGEAQLSAMVAGRFGPEVETALRQLSPDLLHMEQYMDFLRNRMFRQTLLCHAECELNQSLNRNAVGDFYIASSLIPAGNADVASEDILEFQGAGTQKLATRDPLMKAAMLILGESSPMPMKFDQLATQAAAKAKQPTPTEADLEALARRFLNCYSSQLVEFSLEKPRFVSQVTARPITCPYARLRSKLGTKVTNTKMESVELSEPSRFIFQSLDGSNDKPALIQRLSGWLETHPSGTPEPEGQPPQSDIHARATKYVDELLALFARHALLVG